MKTTIFIVLLASASFAAAGDQNTAIAASASFFYSNTNSMFLPYFALSAYLIRNIGYHDLTFEYMQQGKTSNKNEIKYMWMGLNYSLLFKLPIKFLYLGPTIGLSQYLYTQKSDSSSSEDNEVFFGGAKVALIFGENTFRFKIDNRLLLGPSFINGKTSMAVNDVIWVGLIIAFNFEVRINNRKT